MSHKPHPQKNLMIRLFGAPEIQLDGALITGLPTKTQALLFYLAVTGQAQQRLTLATLLWSETSEKNARASLRKALRQLHTTFPNHIHLAQQSVTLKPDEAVWVDVVVFEDNVTQTQPEGDLQTLQAATALYQDDFLSGFLVRNAPDFEAWQAAQHTRLREMMLDGLQALSRNQLAKHQLEPAIATTRRLLDIEPWREEAHRQLMILLAETGQRTAALHQYENCRQALWDELAIEPSDATKSLYQRLGTVTASNAHLVRSHFVTTVDYRLVGREAEWANLQTRWQTLAHPHFITISGEPGIGKTRLAEEMLMLAEREGHPVARTRSHALEGRLAYGPVADWLRTDSLKSTLSQLDPIWLTEITRILPELRIEHPNLPQPEPLKDSWQRKQFFEAVAQPFIQQPNRLLLVLDDLQWCDSDTLEWLHYLLEEAHSPLLVIGTVRGEEVEADHPLPHIRSQLQRRGRASDIALTYLSASATAVLAAQVADNALEIMQADDLFDDTGGNPLFVIEQIRAMNQDADRIAVVRPDVARGDNQTQFIPPQIYSLIQARLQRLSPEATQAAEIGAAIGRAFDLDLLSHALETPSDNILTALDELWHQRIIREVDNTRFDFSHDRLRDVVYAEISPIRRRLLHRQVARGLETYHSHGPEAVYGQLATHYKQGGLPEKAIDYSYQAAKQALQLSASQEAITYLNNGLELLETLPPHDDWLRQKLAFQTTLAVPIGVIKGPASNEVQAIYLQAQALSEQLGEPPSIPVLRGLASILIVRANLTQACRFLEDMLAQVKNSQDPEHLSVTHYGLATALFWMGQHHRACTHFRQAIHHYEQISFQSHTAEYPTNPVIICNSFLANSLWCLGYPDQALQCSAENLLLAEKVGHGFSHANALSFSSRLQYCCSRPEQTLRYADQSIQISTAQGLTFWIAVSRTFRGWALAALDKPTEGLTETLKGIEEYNATDGKVSLPWFLGLAASIYLKIGGSANGLLMIEQGLEVAHQTGDCIYEPELWRLKGELLLQKSQPATEAEAAFCQAIQVAQAQQAKSWELRATTSLCRLWQKQGKTAEAYQRLATIYGWFTEGFDTADLLEAKALLQELEVG